jgi:hypothetical protein
MPVTPADAQINPSKFFRLKSIHLLSCRRAIFDQAGRVWNRPSSSWLVLDTPEDGNLYPRDDLVIECAERKADPDGVQTFNVQRSTFN